MSPILWVAAALGHGGPPRTDTLLWDTSNTPIAATSHGLIFEDDGFTWVCDEVLGAEAPSLFARTSETVLMGTTEGIAWSTTGCDWTWSEGTGDTVMRDIRGDRTEPGWVWLVTDDGIRLSTDHGRTFSFADTPNPSADLRAFDQSVDGRTLVLGFLDGIATAWVGDASEWHATHLDVDGGQLSTLGADESGNFYVRASTASGADDLMLIPPDGQPMSILQTQTRIHAFLPTTDGWMASVQEMGTILSIDQGETWQTVDRTSFRCLFERKGRTWACPPTGSNSIWTSTDTDLFRDSPEWTDGPNFSDIRGPHCPGLLERCDAVWPIVASELGISEVDEQADDAAAGNQDCGCSSQGKSALLLPWALLWLGRRRNDKGPPQNTAEGLTVRTRV